MKRQSWWPVVILFSLAAILFVFSMVLGRVMQDGVEKQIKQCIADGGKPYTHGKYDEYVTCVEPQ